VLKPNFCYLVSNPNSTKFTIQYLPSVMVLQSVPHPQLAILISSLMPISPFPIRFLHLLARASTTSGISDAIRPVLDFSTAHIIGTSLVQPKLDYCNSLYYVLPKTQLTPLQHIQNSLARAVVAAPRSSDPDQILKSLHWLKV